MRTTSRTLYGLLCLILAIPAVVHAGTYSARVRWQPAPDAAVTGYRIYIRPADGAYGTPQDAGAPATQSDGTLSVQIDGLQVRTEYAFAVTSYRSDGAESGLSNELRIGYAQVAPYVDSDGDGLRDGVEDVNLNRLVDAGETDPEDADSDGDGVGDATDRCQGTPAGADAGVSGCACTQISCDNGDACDGVEGCAAGECQAGTPPNCSDGNPCTVDACGAASGCTHTPIAGCASCTTAADCEDGNACTLDLCSAGRCRNVAVSNGTPCSDGSICNGVETCQAGSCRSASPLSCDDDNACTTDRCDEVLGRCVHDGLSNCCVSDSDCADSDACTINERCDAGQCVSDPVICEEAGGICTGTICDPQEGCTVSVVPDGEACDDADSCTVGEVCRGGACVNPVRSARAASVGRDLRVTRFVLRRAGRRTRRLVAQGVFSAQDIRALIAEGVTIELRDAAGGLVYSATVPGSAFIPQRVRLVYIRSDDQPPDGLRILKFTRGVGSVEVTLRATVPATLGAPAPIEGLTGPAALPGGTGQSSVSWLMRFGEGCVLDRGITCFPRAAGTKRCHGD